MKKILNSIVLLLTVFPIITFASELTCEYTGDSCGLTLKYKYGEKLILEYNKNGNKTCEWGNSESALENKDMIDENGNVFCPQLCWSNKIDGQKKYKIVFDKDTGSCTNSISGNASNAIYDDAEKTTPDPETHVCYYHSGTSKEVYISYNGSEVVGELTGSDYKESCDLKIAQDWTAADFENGKCPGNVNILKTDKQGLCTVKISNKDLTGNEGLLESDKSENVYDGEEIDEDDFGDNTGLDAEKQNCESLLGKTTTPKTPAWYMMIVFNVMKYVAIVLLIALTIMDYVGAITSQDNDQIKKVTQKTIKRAILCVAIFILPTLIEFVLQFIDKATTTCEIGG